MSIVESLKVQLKTLEGQRREHEKAANAIRRNEVKIRKALSSVASLPAVTQSGTCFNSFEANGGWTRVHSPSFGGMTVAA